MQCIPYEIEKNLHQEHSISVMGFRAAHGGCINNGGELITHQGSYFIKWNDSLRYPKMFRKEAIGLQLLSATGCIHIPEVVLVEEDERYQFILLEFIASALRQSNYWYLLGERLARLHQNTAKTFGLDHDNYIGSLTQGNTQESSWTDFFIQHRLEAQVNIAEKHHRLDAGARRQFELLYKKLPGILPEEMPSLLHGDLWGGNVMVNHVGEPALIDPAVYYGNREAELAYTQLFGGFDSGFYDAYNTAFPPQPGYDERVDVYNLYPLLVHVNLFGGGYFQLVKRILNRYT